MHCNGCHQCHDSVAAVILVLGHKVWETTGEGSDEGTPYREFLMKTEHRAIENSMEVFTTAWRPGINITEAHIGTYYTCQNQYSSSEISEKRPLSIHRITPKS